MNIEEYGWWNKFSLIRSLIQIPLNFIILDINLASRKIHTIRTNNTYIEYVLS